MDAYGCAGRLTSLIDGDVRRLDSLISKYSALRSTVAKLATKQQLSSDEEHSVRELEASLRRVSNDIENFEITVGEWDRQVAREVGL